MTEKPNANPTGPEGTETEPEDKTDWKAMARQWEARSKAHEKEVEKLRPKADRYQALEDESKTEIERVQAQLADVQKSLLASRDLTVRSRIEALAANDFADPADAAAVLDPHAYLTLEGQVNDTAIKQELANLLALKPHWRKTGTSGARPPAFNPAQGTGGQPTAATKGSLFAAVLEQAQGRGSNQAS
jgi:hypothetical protein